MGAADIDLVHAALLQDADGVEDRRARVDLVVDDDHAGLFDVADHVHDLAATAVVAVRLLHEDERDLEVFGDAAGRIRVAEIRHDECDAFGVLLDDRTKRLDQQIAR